MAVNSPTKYEFNIDFSKLKFLTNDLSKMQPYNIPIILFNFDNPDLSNFFDRNMSIKSCMTT